MDEPQSSMSQSRAMHFLNKLSGAWRLLRSKAYVLVTNSEARVQIASSKATTQFFSEVLDELIETMKEVKKDMEVKMKNVRK